MVQPVGATALVDPLRWPWHLLATNAAGALARPPTALNRHALIISVSSGPGRGLSRRLVLQCRCNTFPALWTLGVRGSDEIAAVRSWTPKIRSVKLTPGPDSPRTSQGVELPQTLRRSRVAGAGSPPTGISGGGPKKRQCGLNPGPRHSSPTVMLDFWDHDSYSC